VKELSKVESKGLDCDPDLIYTQAVESMADLGNLKEETKSN
jgi:hypothetical protein